MDLKSLKFAPTHEWVLLEGDVATVGISKFAVDQLTDLIMIELPAVGTRVAAGKSFGEIESVKAVSDLYAPLAGEVVEVNSQVTSNVSAPRGRPLRQGLADQDQGRPAGRHVRLDGPRRVRGKGGRGRSLIAQERSSGDFAESPADAGRRRSSVSIVILDLFM